MSFFRQRGVNGDIVGFGQQFFKRNELHANLLRAFFGNIRVVADGGHFHGLHAQGNAAADTPNADNTERFALYLNAVKALSVPFAGLNGSVRLRNVARHGHHHGNGVFRGGNGVAFRRVKHYNAACRRCGNVDIINTDARAADNL